MPITITYDHQQGATLGLSVDSLALRIVKIDPIKVRMPVLDSTYLGTTVKRTKASGELKDYQGVKVVYQNTPNIANPALGVNQVILVTGPIPPGGTAGEFETGSGFVYENEDMPGFDASQEGLQMKEMTWIYDGVTGPTRTAAA